MYYYSVKVVSDLLWKTGYYTPLGHENRSCQLIILSGSEAMRIAASKARERAYTANSVINPINAIVRGVPGYYLYRVTSEDSEALYSEVTIRKAHKPYGVFTDAWASAYQNAIAHKIPLVSRHYNVCPKCLEDASIAAHITQCAMRMMLSAAHFKAVSKGTCYKCEGPLT